VIFFNRPVIIYALHDSFEVHRLMRMSKERLSFKHIFVFWVPLAATWFMMAAEGPFLAAFIARLADPKHNLAAYGVAFSFAVLVEAPIIMIMSASTALVKDKDSFIKLRNFTYILNGAVTFIMIIFLLPPVFHFMTEGLIKLPQNVAHLTHDACLILVPWPAAIGYRRFYQGILIRSNLTRRVAYGTLVRLSTMASTAFACHALFELHGAAVGALSLSMGVCAEAIVSRFMAAASVESLLSKEQTKSRETMLDYGYITRFYYPLALTSILALTVQPLVTLFMGHSHMAIESLAVLPVINSVVFIFRSVGLSFQEVGIALLGESNQGYRPLRDFSVVLGLAATGGLSLIAFTPLSAVWFHHVSGLSLELTQFAILPTKILAAIPGLMVLLSFQRSVLVSNRQTTPITLATVIEVAGITVCLFIAIKFLGLIGAIAAALSLVIGRLFANCYLFVPYFRVLRSKHTSVPGFQQI
jgi:hypothetical protein